MTRTVAALAVAAIAACLLAVVTGLASIGGDGHGGEGAALRPWLVVVHAASAHAAAAASAALAAVAFLLGLRGLLSTTATRRALAAVLFLFGPAVMAAVIGAELSGFASGRSADGDLGAAARAALIDRHGALATGLLLVAVGALVVLLHASGECAGDEES